MNADSHGHGDTATEPILTEPIPTERISKHVSRFQHRSHSRRWIILILFASAWVTIRWGYDTWTSDRETNISRLIETDYDVVAIPSPFELVLSRSASDGRDARNEQARVRILGVRRPWQWNSDPERWKSEAMEAVATWIDTDPVHVRLSRRQISEEGVLLTHLCRGEELLSDYLVRQGWATVDTDIDPSDGVIRQLYRAEDEARLAARGIWSGRALGLLNHPGL